MEVRVAKRKLLKREKSLAGMFLGYVALFCVNTLLLLAAIVLLFDYWLAKGIVIPANFGESSLQKNIQCIVNDEVVSEELIPEGCFFGVYDSAGEWKYGTFSGEEQKSAWEHYLKNQTVAEYGYRQYYRFYERKNGEIAIVRIYMTAHFAADKGEVTAVNLENLLIVVFLVFFLLQTVILSKMFAKQLNGQLKALQQVTKEIAENNLEFEAAHSDVKEIEQVLISLNQMRDALKNSLKQQWDMEQRKKEQLAALAHDIKTPLAVIRGNSELLEESGLAEEEEECNRYILQSTGELENYFSTMRELLSSERKVQKKEKLQVEKWQELLVQQAELLQRVYQVKLSVQKSDLEGSIIADKVSILRAWNNLLDNALEYTKKEQGIRISFEVKERERKKYFVAEVEDYGRGFLPEELRYGTEEFYRGDESRKGREHQGLGLAIARKFVEEEGGFLFLDNSKETKGAVVSLWLPILE